MKPAVKLACLLLSAIVALTGCGAGGPDLTETLNSDNGLQMRIPDTWSADDQLNPVAVIQASNREAESYVVVISDLKDDLAEDATLEEFGEIAVEEFVSSLSDTEVTAPAEVEGSELDALRYGVTASADELELSYLFTVMETPDSFIQVIAWTLRSQMAEQRETLEAISNSVSLT